MLERDIERIVNKHAVDQGFLSFKFTSPNNRGVPDRIFIAPNGQVIFVEFKQKGMFLTKLQHFMFNLFESRGCKIHVVNDVVDGIDLLNKYKETYK